MVYNRSGRQLTTTNDEGAPHSKRARMLAGNSLEGSKERDDYDNGERKNQAFITARDQHVCVCVCECVWVCKCGSMHVCIL